MTGIVLLHLTTDHILFYTKFEKVKDVTASDLLPRKRADISCDNIFIVVHELSNYAYHSSKGKKKLGLWDLNERY